MIRKAIKPLTSLRFIFALMVFVSHCHFLESSDYATMRWLFREVFFEGYIGVTFFFILSGFILTYTYYDRLNNYREIKQYFIARIVKIYPMHILLFTAMAAIIFYKNGLSSELLAKAIINFSLLQSFVPIRDIYFSFNMPSWSLSCEIFFYMTLPPVISYIKKRNLKVIVFFGTIMLTAILIGMLTTIIENQHYMFYINPIVRFADFSLGIILFLTWERIKNFNLKINFTLLEVLALIVFSIFFIWHNKIPIVFRYSVYYWLPTSLIILIFAMAKGKVSQLLNSSALLTLGKISFAFYMIHQPIINLINRFSFLSTEISFITSLFSSIIISYILFKYFENPLSHQIKKIQKTNYF